MRQLADSIWIFDGEAVPFFTLPYTTRMVVVRLPGNLLWVHSPIRLTDDLKAQINSLGQVAYLVAPNHLHHLFLKPWQQNWPDSQLFGTTEVQHKCPQLTFSGTLVTENGQPWNNEIDQQLVTGSPFMQECVFFHRASKTLIVTDLIENFSPAAFPPFKRLVARVSGILAPNGKMPIDWRSSFLFGRKQARVAFQQIIDWHPERVVMAHGEVVEQNAADFLQRSFSWIL